MKVCTPQIKQTLLNALEVARDDSLERAQWAFKGMTSEQMQQQYGHSGHTRQQVLDTYQAARDCNETARVWVSELETGEQQ